MKAVAYRNSLPVDDPLSLQDVELPDPSPPTGRDLLVEVRSVSVNPVDHKVRRRVEPGGAPKVLGWDAAGVVRAAGPDARLFHPGDAVFYAGDIGRTGTNAELHLVDERIVGPKPLTLSFAEAAAVPLTAITAWEALFDRLRMPRADAAGPDGAGVLIVGGAGGVGSMAVQLARRLTGFRVIATAARPESAAWARQMGAHDVVDHARDDLAAQVRALGAPVPFVFVTTHTEQHWAAICDLVAPQGALCLIDDPVAAPDIRPLKGKSVSVHWESMFTRSMHATHDIEAQHRLLAEVSRLLDAGALRTTLAEHYGAIDAAALRPCAARKRARARQDRAEGVCVTLPGPIAPAVGRPGGPSGRRRCRRAAAALLLRARLRGLRLAPRP